MLVPVSWLKDYVDLDLSAEQLAERITLAGLEVEGIQRVGDWWDSERIVVGQVLEVHKHPDADRLVLVDVNYGGRTPERVVTGATNLLQYLDKTVPVLKVPFALAGAELIDGYSDARSRKVLKASKIRGIMSSGMICSERELGLSDKHDAIMLLPEEVPVGLSLREYLGDVVLDVSITPDMARCLSVIGVAREVSALIDSPLRTPTELLYTDTPESQGAFADIFIEDSNLCARYVGMLLRDVQVRESPLWMRLRLRKAGIKPINNIVDVGNYVMLEHGQPMHVFDYDLLLARAANVNEKTPRIIIRTAKSGEKITTLDGVERELDESMLVVADAVGSIAIAGVIGGLETAINSESRNVFLESATFEGVNNRRTAQKVKVQTDSSHRFTRGVPATLNIIAARRAAGLICKNSDGRVSEGVIDNYPSPQVKPVVYVTERHILRQLGIKASLSTAASLLRRLDFEVETVSAADLSAKDAGKGVLGLSFEEGETLLRCTAPWHRLDIQIPGDVTEEVARMIGYARIETTSLADTLPPQRRNINLETETKIRDTLVGCGLQETINYSLTTSENHDKLRLNNNFDGLDPANPYITLANPLSTSRSVLRRSMLVSAVENLAYNASFTSHLATFEIGRVYLHESGDGVRPNEESRLSILLTGRRRLPSLHSQLNDEDFDFFDLKGIVETLLKRLRVSDIEYVATSECKTFTPNCAEIRIKGEYQGIMGELHPEISAAFDLPRRAVYLAESRIAPLVRPSWQLEVMEPISNYPAVVEDLAFIVGEEITAQQALAVISRAEGSFSIAAQLFDVYRGDPLPAGHKSFAFMVTYQSLTSTLSDTEVVSARNRIVNRMTEELGGKLRGLET